MTEPQIERMIKLLVIYAAGKLRRLWFRRVRLDPEDVVYEALVRLERGRQGQTGPGARQRNRQRYPELADQLTAIVDSLIADEVRRLDHQLTEAAPEQLQVSDQSRDPERQAIARAQLERFYDALYELILDAPDNEHLLACLELLESRHTLDQADWMVALQIDRAQANNLKKRLTRLMHQARRRAEGDDG